MRSTDFSNIIAPGLAKVIQDKFKQFELQYPKYMHIFPSKKAYEQSLTMEGFGAAPIKLAGVSVNYFDLTEGYKTTFTHATYAVGAKIEYELYDDDLYDALQPKIARYLARSLQQRMEILGATPINTGFTTAGADGQVLFSTAHPFKSGGTASNRLAVDADLSTSSLSALLTVMDTTTEAGAVNIKLNPTKLLIPPQSRWVAKTILGSDQLPGSMDNDINALKNILKPVMCNFFTDSDAFFVQDEDHDMTYYDREKPKMENSDDKDTFDAKFTIRMRSSAGYSDWRGIAGSRGA